ncbi:MAG: hypothetical protein ABSE47_15200, partial [Acidimicrobiales bacterium]
MPEDIRGRLRQAAAPATRTMRVTRLRDVVSFAAVRFIWCESTAAAGRIRYISAIREDVTKVTCHLVPMALDGGR